MDKDKLIKELMSEVSVLRKQVTSLLAKNDELERRLNKNSSNSSKPPSSDGLSKKPSPKSLREKGQRPTGGQSGHQGWTLKQVSRPDHIVLHDLVICLGCSAGMAEVEAGSYEARQVFDLPDPVVEITEHRGAIKCCKSCGRQSTASFPPGVTSYVQYGANIKSYISYLSYQQLIPEARIQQLMLDLFGCRISTGSIGNICTNIAGSMEGIQDSVLNAVKVAPVKHADETGMRIGGKTNWLHVLSTDKLTHYRVGPKRGAMMGGVEGILVHDHFKSYYGMKGLSHALCNAHHLRELQALVEEKEVWASKMKKLLILASKLKDKKPARVGWIMVLYDKIVANGIKYHEELGQFDRNSTRKKRPGHNLLLRLRDHKQEVLRFLTTDNVPFTNNLSEQDIRMMKVKQKISGGFRASYGAEQFCVARGFISTCRKQGLNIIKAIADIIIGSQPNFQIA